MNRASTVAAVVWLDQLIAAAKAKRDELAQQLDAEARAQYTQDGAAPSWRIPEVATVSSRVTHASAKVVDEDAFLRWCQRYHPGEVETVQQVRPGFRTKVLAEAVDGDVPPGVEVDKGGRFAGITVRPTSDAKRIFGLVAADGLKHAALQAGSVVAPAFAEIESGTASARCRVCGCSDVEPCEDGCMWVQDPEGIGDICSRCVGTKEAGSRA